MTKRICKDCRLRPLAVLGIVLIPDLFWVALADNAVYALQHGLAFSLCLLIGALAWSQRRLGVLLFFGLPFALLVPFETYYIWRYTFPSSPHVLAIIGETNVSEAREYFGYPLFFGLSSLVLLIAAIFLFEIRQAGFKKLYAENRIWRWLGVAMLLPFFSLAISEFSLHTTSSSLAQEQDENSRGVRSLLKDVRFGMNEVIATSFPFGVPFRISTYRAEQGRLVEAREKSKKLKVIAATPENAPAELVVLMIGESARPDHWHMNGYTRQTTPQIEKFPDVVSFSNVISPWPATRHAVPTLLTGLIGENLLPPVAVPSVIDVFRAAGWQTYWLSNQSPLGMHDSTIVLHAERAQYRRFLNGADYTQAADYDEVLIPALEESLSVESKQKKFIVLHLLGSHLDYANRFPVSFARFDDAKDVDSKVGGFFPIHNDYDNSILYTDYVIGQVIKRLKDTNKSAVLFYISDHGQNIPDLECNKIGHGHNTEDTFRVAALTWVSSQMKQKAPTVFPLLQNKKSAPLHLQDVFHTLIDLSGIDYAGLNVTKSWSSNSWKHEKRPMGMVKYFDDMVLSGSCRTLENPSVENHRNAS